MKNIRELLKKEDLSSFDAKNMQKTVSKIYNMLTDEEKKEAAETAIMQQLTNFLIYK